MHAILISPFDVHGDLPVPSFSGVSAILFQVGSQRRRHDIARCRAPGAMQGTLIPWLLIVGMGFVENAMVDRCCATKLMAEEFIID
jgi:hypothetical protein